MHHVRTGITALCVAGVIVSLPATAWAYSAHRESFNGTIISNQRKPADSDNDWSMPSRSGAGTVVTDASGQVGQYQEQLVRDISWAPDQVVHRATGIQFNAPTKYFVTLSWPSGRFHFDFRVTVRGDSNGYGEARW